MSSNNFELYKKYKAIKDAHQAQIDKDKLNELLKKQQKYNDIIETCHNIIENVMKSKYFFENISAYKYCFLPFGSQYLHSEKHIILDWKHPDVIKDITNLVQSKSDEYCTFTLEYSVRDDKYYNRDYEAGICINATFKDD